MTLAEYIHRRWSKLSPESKRILGLDQIDAQIFTYYVWMVQYYEQRMGDKK